MLCLNCNSQEWITYSSPDHTFTIKFPGQPEVMNLDSNFGIDSTQIFQYFQMDSLDSYVYMLTILYLSDEIIKPEFNEEKRFEVLQRYSAIQIGLTGRVINTERISLSGYPGIYIEGEITQAVNKEPYPPKLLKSYLVENKLYILQVSCSFENKKSSLIEYFFKSFNLL